MSLFGQEFNRQFTKEIQIPPKKKNFAFPANIIFEADGNLDIQFDLHPGSDIQTVIASTFIAHEQISEGSKPST